MSCADVCLDHDFEESNEFYSERVNKARKAHKCCECHQAIIVGALYERCAGKSDGTFWTVATCGPCAEIRKAFVCGSWTFGELWSSIRDYMFPIWEEAGPIDCLAKLDTLEARNKCRRAYDDWKAKR